MVAVGTFTDFALYDMAGRRRRYTRVVALSVERRRHDGPDIFLTLAHAAQPAGRAGFFQLHVRLYGNDWRALGWQSRHTQYRRFAVLAEVGDLAHTRVLDVGCGLGDLYGYLCTQSIPVTYTGMICRLT